MTSHRIRRRLYRFLGTMLTTAIVSLGGMQASNAAPKCLPNDTKPICVCGKPVCDPPPPPKYGTRSYAPAYFVLSLLYAPPGAASNVGFSQSNSEGTTTGISSSFGTGMTFSVNATGGLFAQTTLGATFSETGSEQHASNFQTTATSAQGAQVSAKSDAVDHSQDRFFLWLNPLVTVTQTGSQSATYAMGTLNGDPMDIIDVSLEEVTNPSLIPAAKLGPQIIHGVSLPGLGKLQPSDFAAIASMDTVTSVTDVPADTKRYVYIESLPLEGPDSEESDPVKYTTSVSDGTVTSNTTTDTRNITASLVMGDKIDIPGVFTVNLTITSSLIWQYATSSGTTSGTNIQANLTLGTSKVGCLEYVDVYSDVIFHTMVYTTPQPTCAPISGGSVAPPPALSGTLQDSAGRPIPHEVVVVALSDGLVRRIYTDSKGRYILYSAPAGAVKISAAGLTSQATIETGKPTVAVLKTK